VEFEDLFCKISTFGVFTVLLGKKVEGSLPYLSGPYTTAIFYNLQPECKSGDGEEEKGNKKSQKFRPFACLPIGK
jgi:hypothetical protein